MNVSQEHSCVLIDIYQLKQNEHYVLGVRPCSCHMKTQVPASCPTSFQELVKRQLRCTPRALVTSSQQNYNKISQSLSLYVRHDQHFWAVLLDNLSEIILGDQSAYLASPRHLPLSPNTYSPLSNLAGNPVPKYYFSLHFHQSSLLIGQTPFLNSMPSSLTSCIL